MGQEEDKNVNPILAQFMQQQRIAQEQAKRQRDMDPLYQAREKVKEDALRAEEERRKAAEKAELDRQEAARRPAEVAQPSEKDAIERKRIELALMKEFAHQQGDTAEVKRIEEQLRAFEKPEQQLRASKAGEDADSMQAQREQLQSHRVQTDKPS